MDQNFVDRYSNTTAQQGTEGVVSRTFLLNVYNWMAIGLAITGFVAWGVSRFVDEYFFAEHIYVFYGLLIFELIFVFALSAAINKIPAIVAILGFFFYAFLNGLTMSVIFMVYTSASIYMTFFVCAGMFAGMSAFGYLTKIDLSGFGSFLYMGLIGVVIGSVVNLFWANSILYWLVTYVGIIVFVGLTAYDTQKIKKMAMEVDAGSEQGKKGAVMGALRLYLDFINLFLLLLRLMGGRK
jgi:hypothetical protein